MYFKEQILEFGGNLKNMKKLHTCIKQGTKLHNNMMVDFYDFCIIKQELRMT